MNSLETMVSRQGAYALPRKPAGGGSPCGDRKEGASPHGLRLRLAVCAAPSLALSGLAAPPDTKSPFGPREIARSAGDAKKGVGESGGVDPFRAACETGVFVFRFRRFSCPPSGRTRRVADKARAANGLPFMPRRTDVRPVAARRSTAPAAFAVARKRSSKPLRVLCERCVRSYRATEFKPHQQYYRAIGLTRHL